MSVQLVLKNSSVQDKEATAAQLAVGELALNYHSSGPFLQCEDSAGNIWRLGGVVIASTAPSSPSRGAWWLDSDDDHLYFYNGSSWIEIQTGEIVPGDITEGTARQLLQTNAAGNGTEWTSNIDVPGTLDVTGVATFDNNVVITGNLTVNGTTTTIDTTTLVVEDKNIELGVVGTPTDTTADGGGITVKGATDKTLTWVNSTGMWTSNQPLDVAGEVQCDSLDVDGAADIAGTLTTNRLVVDDDGSASPTAVFKADDGSPYAISIKNDAYSTDESIGLLAYQESGGHINVTSKGNSEYRTLRLQQNNGTTARNGVVFSDGGNVNLYYQDSQKLTTTTNGIDVTGSVTCDTSINVESSSAYGQIECGGPSGGILDLKGPFSDDYDFRMITTGAGGTIDVNGNQLRIDGVLVPDADDTYDLGQSGLQWRNAYFDGTVNCDGLSCAGDATIESTSGILRIKDNNTSGDAAAVYIQGVDSADSQQWYLGAGTDANLQIWNSRNGQLNFATNDTLRAKFKNDGHFVPHANNTYDLGGSTAQWRNGYFDGTVYTDGLQCDGDLSIRSGYGTLLLRDTSNSGTGAQTRVAFEDSNGNTQSNIGHLANNNNDLYVSNESSANLVFRTAATSRCYVDGTGHFQPAINNAYDIGSNSNQWRNAYFDGTVYTDLLEVANQAGFQGKVYGAFRTATASSFNLATGNFWTFGTIAVPNPSNQTAGISGLLVATAAPTSFASNWKFPGGTYTAPTSFPAVAPFFIQASGTILVGSWTEGIA